MGVVYLGHDEAAGRRVAIKVLQPELCDDADRVPRFFHEARAATAIRSPGIVQVFDFGVTPDRRAYFVGGAPGGRVARSADRAAALDFAECCRLGRQLNASNITTGAVVQRLPLPVMARAVRGRDLRRHREARRARRRLDPDIEIWTTPMTR